MTIKEAREKAALTQSGAAKMLNVPIRTWQDWEYGRRKPPEWAEALIIRELERKSKL